MALGLLLYTGGATSQFPSRAAPPPNQRPQCAGSQFKLRGRRLAGIGSDRVGPQPQGRAGHGAPHRGAWAVPGHQAGE